jgi:branched-chain amino acid transport system permease protein
MRTATLTRTRAAVAAAAHDVRGAWRWPASVAAGGVVLALLAPLVLDSVQVQGLASWLYLALAATGLGFAVGLAGMPSLGQGAFMAIGAFTAALLRAKVGAGPLEATLAGLAVTTLAGFVLGIGFVRLGRVLFAVATWLLAWLVALGLGAFPAISGGAQGLVISRGSFTETAHYELALVLGVLAAIALFAIARGVPGLALSALRERRAAALALGVPATRLRLGAFVASAGLGGLAGALSVQLAGIADPGGYGPFLSFKLFAAVLLGGMTTAIGGLAGLGVISGISHLSDWIGALEHLSTTRFDPMIAALLLLVVLGLGGEGIVPYLRRISARLRPAPARPVPHASTPSPAQGAVLGVRGIRKVFGGVVALADLSLEAHPGTIVALIGPNGSGKTTALRAFSGTLVPDSGRIELDGEPIAHEPLERRVELGIVRTLQRTAVFERMTALENVLVGADLRRRYGGAARTVLATPKSRAERARIRGSAHGRLEAVGLGESAETPAAELSSSEQRLLMLASALAGSPRVLLLDEPSAGASAEDVRRLAQILRQLRESGLSIVLVEHNLRLVRAVASNVVVLDHGHVIASGSPDEIASLPRVREAYLGKHRL